MTETAESSATSRTSVSYDAEAQQDLDSADQQPLISQTSGLSTAPVAGLPDKSVLSRLKLDKLYSLIWNNGLACIAVASLCSSFGALSVKFIDGRVPVFEIVIVRSAICWLVTDAVGRVQKVKPLYGATKRYPVLAVRGLTGALAMTLYYEALQRLPLGDMMTMYFIYPAITVVLAWLVHGEAITWLAFVGCGISLTGVALIAQPPFLFGGASEQYNMSHWLGVASAFGSACSAASAMIAIRAIKKSETSLTVALWFHSAAVVASAPLLAFGYPDSAVLPVAKDWGLLMGIAVLSFINQMCLNRGFQLEVAAKASAVNYTQVLYAHIWGVAFLGEREHVGGIAGSLLLAGGVVTVNLSKSKPAVPGPDEMSAFVAGVESKAVDYDDTRITLGSTQANKRDEWQEADEAQEVELTSSRV